jgi:hypothetical protein
VPARRRPSSIDFLGLEEIIGEAEALYNKTRVYQFVGALFGSERKRERDLDLDIGPNFEEELSSVVTAIVKIWVLGRNTNKEIFRSEGGRQSSFPWRTGYLLITSWLDEFWLVLYSKR